MQHAGLFSFFHFLLLSSTEHISCGSLEKIHQLNGTAAVPVSQHFFTAHEEGRALAAGKSKLAEMDF